MGKTLTIIDKRAGENDVVVLANEIARSVYMDNPPSLQTMKVFYLMMQRAGGQIAADITHSLPMSEIHNASGSRKHTRASLLELFRELRAATFSYEQTTNLGTLVDEDGQRRAVQFADVIDGYINRVVVRYADDERIEIQWKFSETFRLLVQSSDFWTLLDFNTVNALRCKYSEPLFRYIASFVEYDHVHSERFTVDRLRKLLGVPDGKLPRFANLNARVLSPALAEINQLARFNLEMILHKHEKTVVEIEIKWTKKVDLSDTKRELSGSKVGRKARRDGTAERPALPFPTSGGLDRTVPSEAHWYKLFEAHVNRIQGGQLPSSKLVCDAFRQKLGGDLDAPNIEKRFIGFCESWRG